jgi:hypothetical protein
MKKTAVIALLAASMFAGPAMAGNASMKGPDGTKMRVDCTAQSCVVKEKAAGGKWATTQKAAPGVDSFNAVVADYKSRGYK